MIIKLLCRLRHAVQQQWWMRYLAVRGYFIQPRRVHGVMSGVRDDGFPCVV